jgi:hypothetical protein
MPRPGSAAPVARAYCPDAALDKRRALLEMWGQVLTKPAQEAVAAE